MNNDLKDFATKILKHLEGKVWPVWFESDCGLCSNLESYTLSKGYGYQRRLKVEGGFKGLLAAFSDKECSSESEAYPFDLSALQYYEACVGGTLYVNPLRLAFLKVLKNL